MPQRRTFSFVHEIRRRNLRTSIQAVVEATKTGGFYQIKRRYSNKPRGWFRDRVRINIGRLVTHSKLLSLRVLNLLLSTDWADCPRCSHTGRLAGELRNSYLLTCCSNVYPINQLGRFYLFGERVLYPRFWSYCLEFEDFPSFKRSWLRLVRCGLDKNCKLSSKCAVLTRCWSITYRVGQKQISLKARSSCMRRQRKAFYVSNMQNTSEA